MPRQTKEDAKLYPLAAVGVTKGLYEVFVKPKLSAKRAWAALGIGVLAYDLTCPKGELMSEGTDRALGSHPLITRAAIGITALHLANLLPETIDPFAQGIKFLKQTPG